MQDRYDIPDYFKEKMQLNSALRTEECVGKKCGRTPYPRYPYHPCQMGGFCEPVAVPYQERMQPPFRERMMQPPFREKMMQPPFHGRMPQHEPIPFYQAYPESLFMQEEMDDDRDWERIRDMYPQNAKRIQMLVDEQADKMEKDGSLMFDQYPDKLMMEQIINELYMNFMRMYMQRQSEDSDNLEDMFEGDCKDCDLDEDTIKDLIAVLLFQEMYRRRCRNRQCNRWW